MNSTLHSALKEYHKILQDAAEGGLSLTHPKVNSQWDNIQKCTFFASTILTTIGEAINNFTLYILQKKLRITLIYLLIP